jgi:4-diphosphocytidyl-2-C-methyl-D-erythritol kinase
MLYCERAYAKVNLHLKVLGTRTDGYHDIFSIMSSVGLFDLLKLYECNLTEKTPPELTMKIHAEGGQYPELISGIETEKNLMFKACREYLKAAGLSGFIDVGIQKNIPAGGGLGGGSSDAAVMLKMLNRRYGNLTENELSQCAERVGSDVPFCLTGGTALCTGTGGNVVPLNGAPDYTLLIVNNGVHVDTKEAYHLLDEQRASLLSENADDLDRDIPQLLCNDIISFLHKAQNDFEPAVFQKNPSIKELKQQMISFGAAFSIMTGSGSTVIGLFKKAENADNAREYFTTKGFYSVVTDFVKI